MDLTRETLEIALEIAQTPGDLSCILLAIPRESVLAALPHLIELDAQRISNRKPSVKDREKEEEEEDDSEDSDFEDIPELSQPLTAEKGTIGPNPILASTDNMGVPPALVSQGGRLTLSS